MRYKLRTRDEHYANDGAPKRILALDGGGLRGILTLGILQRVEDLLRERHGGSDDFRLAHYFDLIAGTSTGAIIAATLALGWKVDEIRAKYLSLGERVFQKSLLRQGLLRAKYDERALIDELQNVYGPQRLLKDPAIGTGLLVVTKRIDSGSAWPISNNPRGRYYAPRPGGTVGNGDYPLWQVVRASTAAPAYFDPERITLVEADGAGAVSGEFVDGGVSPFNNPALMAYMYATLEGYRIGWPAGADKLLLVSIGTGAADRRVKHANLTAAQAIKAVVALMDDCADFQETQLQWMSASRTARVIDRELGDLQHDLIAGAPLLSYLRYNVDLTQAAVQALDPNFGNAAKIEALSAMDAPEHMQSLHRLGTLAGARDVRATDFASTFDLPPA
jgi:Patatin-like phospholipase